MQPGCVGGPWLLGCASSGVEAAHCSPQPCPADQGAGCQPASAHRRASRTVSCLAACAPSPPWPSKHWPLSVPCARQHGLYGRKHDILEADLPEPAMTRLVHAGVCPAALSEGPHCGPGPPPGSRRARAASGALHPGCPLSIAAVDVKRPLTCHGGEHRWLQTRLGKGPLSSKRKGVMLQGLLSPRMSWVNLRQP